MVTIKELAIRDLDEVRKVPRRISEKLLGLYEMLKGIGGKGVYITYSSLPALSRYLDREILTKIYTEKGFYNTMEDVDKYWEIFNLFLMNKRMTDDQIKYFAFLVKEIVKKYADEWVEEYFIPYARKLWYYYDEMGLLHKKNG